MKLGFIGSGKVGAALGKWAAKKNFEIYFSSRTQQSAFDAAKAAGPKAQAIATGQLIEAADIIFLTLPFQEIQETLADYKDELRGKILIDVTNPISEDHQSLTIGHTNSGAETIARSFRQAIVVKAFNHVFADVYEREQSEIAGRKISILYCGDEVRSKACVRELIATLGFDPVDAGPLRLARSLEALSLLNIYLGREQRFGTQIGFSLLRSQM